MSTLRRICNIVPKFRLLSMHLDIIPWNFLSVFLLFNIFLDLILKLRGKSKLFFFSF